MPHQPLACTAACRDHREIHRWAKWVWPKPPAQECQVSFWFSPLRACLITRRTPQGSGFVGFLSSFPWMKKYRFFLAAHRSAWKPVWDALFSFIGSMGEKGTHISIRVNFFPAFSLLSNVVQRNPPLFSSLEGIHCLTKPALKGGDNFQDKNNWKATLESTRAHFSIHATRSSLR